MSKQNSSDRAYSGNMLVLAMADIEEYNFINSTVENATVESLNEYDESMALVEDMIYDAECHNDYEEMRYWRNKLQELRTEKKYCVRAIKNRQKELAIA